MWARAVSFLAPLTSCGEVDSWVASHKLSYLAVPKYVSQGMHTHKDLSYRFLVMPCFGEDIEKKFVQAGRQFGIKTVCYLALRVVRRNLSSVFIYTIHQPDKQYAYDYYCLPYSGYFSGGGGEFSWLRSKLRNIYP